MEQKEHLEKIVARCRELLAAAEKRTPGRWRSGFSTEGMPMVKNDELVQAAVTDYSCSQFGQRELDTNFIASCAGAAEAGWRATIAAVELILQTIDREQGSDYTPLSEDAATQIIAAWLEELL